MWSSKRIYVASSWRNDFQQAVVTALRQDGHEVYDFKNPKEGEKGFSWSEIDPNWKSWTPAQLKEALKHPVAQKGHRLDDDAIRWCNMGVLVLPSGNSAHLETGIIHGSGKPTCVYAPAIREPELMYLSLTELEEVRKAASMICLELAEVIHFARPAVTPV